MVPAHVIEADSGVADVTKIKDTDTTGDVTKFAAAYIKDFTGFNPKFALSAGPYTVSPNSPEQTVMVRNDKYWGNPAGPESLTLVTNTDGQSQVQALQNQEVQVIQPQPNAALAEQLRGSQGITFNAYAGGTYEHIDFNMSVPLFQGKEGLALRQAFFNCVDRTDLINKLVKGVNPETVPLGNFMFLPQESAYQDHYGDYVTANVDKAKSIMEAAGWKLGSDGVYAIGDKKAEFRLGHKVIDTREKVAQLIDGSVHQGRHQGRRRPGRRLQRQAPAGERLRHRAVRVGRHPVQVRFVRHLHHRWRRQLQQVLQQGGRQALQGQQQRA